MAQDGLRPAGRQAGTPGQLAPAGPAHIGLHGSEIFLKKTRPALRVAFSLRCPSVIDARQGGGLLYAACMYETLVRALDKVIYYLDCVALAWSIYSNFQRYFRLLWALRGITKFRVNNYADLEKRKRESQSEREASSKREAESGRFRFFCLNLRFANPDIVRKISLLFFFPFFKCSFYVILKNGETIGSNSSCCENFSQ